MKIEQVKFSKQSTYIGRNGYGYCLGINLTDWNDKHSLIDLTVENTRGNSYSVKIEIPKSDIQQLINKLKMFL